MSEKEKGLRIAEALIDAIEFLLMDPPRRTLARDALRAALNPEGRRWGDE